MAILGLNPKIWITLGPILFINIGLLISLIVYTLTVRSRADETPEAAKRHTSKFLSLHFKSWWVFTTDPIAKVFVRLGVRPSTLTFIGFLFSAVAGFLFAKGLFGYAGWAMIFGATFDIFDGRVARLTGQESRSGAFYDSVMDRFSEGICFLGLAFYFRSSWMLLFVIASLIGSMLVSYTRARGESVGVDCKGGSMQRPERIVYLGVSSVFDPISSTILLNWFAAPPPILVIGAIIIIAVMTNATAVHRMIYIMNALDTTDKSKRETIPQFITKLSTPEGREAFLSKTRYGYDRSLSSFAHIILFVLDGADKEMINKLRRRGDLPNIERHVIERGCMREATSVFPSTTGPAFIPFVTGCFPGTCNVPAARWFDRSVSSTRVLALNRFRDYLGWGAYAMDYDLSKSVRTIFEYSRRAVNIFGMVNRGCGIVRDPAFFRLHSLFRRARRDQDFMELEDVAFQWFADAMRRETDFVYYSFPSVDAAGSMQKDNKDTLIQAYRRFDDVIGKASNLLKELDLYDQTAIFIGSDHSHGTEERSFDLTKFLTDRLPTLRYPTRLRNWEEARVIPLISGTSMAHIYIRNDFDWSMRTFFEDIERSGLVSALLENAEIDIIAGRSADGGVIVQSRRGCAHLVEDQDGRIAYLIKDKDPFGIREIPRSIDAKSAFSLTLGSDYPDGIMQIAQLFRSPRTGDLVISSEKGCTLDGRPDHRRGHLTHGSLRHEHLTVPFLSCIPIGQEAMRTSDIFAFIMDLLGIEAEHRLDGCTTEHFVGSKANPAVGEKTLWQCESVKRI